jgi:hypothetical protein
VIDAHSAAYIGRQAVAALSTHAQEMNVTAVLRMSRPLAASIESSYPALTIADALSRAHDAVPSDLNAASAADPGPRPSISLPAARSASRYLGYDPRGMRRNPLRCRWALERSVAYADAWIGSG